MRARRQCAAPRNQPLSAMTRSAMRKATHGALDKVSNGIERLHFNVCLAHIHEFANALAEATHRPQGAAVSRSCLGVAGGDAGAWCTLVPPMMPHLAEECWAALGQSTGSSPQARGPRSNRRCWSRTPSPCRFRSMARNGRISRSGVTAANAEIEAAVLALDEVKRALDGRPPKKVVIVPQEDRAMSSADMLRYRRARAPGWSASPASLLWPH